MPTDNNDRTTLGATNSPVKTDGGVQSIAEQLGNVPKKIAEKIKSSNNILVALSRDPNVDEISAAIGLTMILNKLGKHVTAIYSGETPNTLEFLKPEQTFEKNTNSLQDFIIALHKDKADHLRYKIEGDYVKVYITPYKTTISQTDFEFSQGDFNVDLVISIDVENAESLDGALSEYGRIMHDATAVNITTNQAGRFAELEWSDPSESSVCEMIVILSGYLDQTEFDQPTATALLTGIVSATDRFSNARTTSETMQVSSRLMQAGADQQLISSNIMQPTTPTPADTTPTLSDAPSAPSAPVSSDASLAPSDTPSASPEAALTSDNANSTDHNSAEPQPTAPAATLEPLIPAPSLMSDESAPSLPEISPSSPNMAPNSLDPALASLEQVVAPQSPTTAGMPPALANELSAVTSAPTPTPTPDSAPTPTQAPVEAVTPTPAVTPAPMATPEIPTPVSLLPSIISQGGVIAQNVVEPVPPTPDYGAMIDQALMGELQATQNPAALVAPSAPARIDDPTIPEIQFMAPVETQTPTGAPISAPASTSTSTSTSTPAPAPVPISAPVPTPSPALTPTQASTEYPVQPQITQPVDSVQSAEATQPESILPELPPAPAPAIDTSASLMPPLLPEIPIPTPAPIPTPTPAVPPIPTQIPTPVVPTSSAPAPVQASAEAVTPTPSVTPTPAPAPETPTSSILDPSAFQIPNA